MTGLDGPAAVAVVRRAGLSAGPVLGSGVEGVVVDVGGAQVAKVWRRRPLDEVTRLADFYAALTAAGPVLATPRIDRVQQVGDHVVSVEARLAGEPLWVADGRSPDLGTREVDAVLETLGALAGVAATPDLRALPVLPGSPAFAADVPFEVALANLVVRRVEGPVAVWARHLPGVDDLVDGVVGRLWDGPVARPTLLHGDLIAANILTLGDRAHAVVDFGFLTTTGDPAFDAAVAASCFDMYGPRAAEIERVLDAAVLGAFGYDAARLATYRAAYALATGTCFAPDGTDGHFTWCVAMLRRPEVLDVLRR